jgi:dsDNA-binding SOS-regulon protein
MSLKNNALLVSLTVGKPQMSKTDTKATKDAELANNAKNAGNYRKDLYPKHLTKPIKDIESSARFYIESIGYQSGRGEYLVPTARYMEFAEQMAKYELAFSQAVTAFLNNWANVLQQAQDQQGDLFEADAYPDVSDLRQRFKFKVKYRPVTDASDFVLDLSDELEEQLKQQVIADMQEQTNEFHSKVLSRLRDVVAHLNVTAGKPDRVTINPRTGRSEPKAPIFKNTVCENILDEIDLLTDFADTLPSDVVDIANEVMRAIPDPDVMRNNPDVRDDAKVNTDALLSKIDAMLGA